MTRRAVDRAPDMQGVTQAELQAELARLRAAVALLANHLGSNVISAQIARRLNDLLAAPEERDPNEVK